MAAVNLPLSGPVTQAISPFMPYFPMLGSQVGSYTVNLGNSSNPAVEKAALDVASYGKQLGRIEDVLLLLLQHLSIEGRDTKEKEAIAALQKMEVATDVLPKLRRMLEDIADEKKRHAHG
ncbi:hypothetical protein [Paraburkholderia phenazinium]|jgi:hypothetical protein|uniref:Uncharacterized protein n=1 Tax=Paraburkholderia phenazinium TaxID=60549 RepID=A0A1G7VP26_9BURK|nr:hypothetical protein [Paraburkholderia phenazinium]SDG61572.1 hypothetical protein SAMN05216466_104162 [Paraburkholderia phenazinium]